MVVLRLEAPIWEVRRVLFHVLWLLQGRVKFRHRHFEVQILLLHLLPEEFRLRWMLQLPVVGRAEVVLHILVVGE
jgi:hypothetical protein